jgi:hypothetical protein
MIWMMAAVSTSSQSSVCPLHSVLSRFLTPCHPQTHSFYSPCIITGIHELVLHSGCCSIRHASCARVRLA